jgi:UDP-N-acetylglucosamine--N-acetylmuramyl-(pentapeptide) pyrophosphoryl-undecaprenol N-acetylglucosamine transferase
MKDYINGEECIAFAVGGTGGHVIPAITIAKNLPGEGQRILIGVDIADNAFVMQKEFPRFNVLGMNFSKGVFTGLFAIGRGVRESVRVLKRENCTHVIGMGGFHSLPVLMAALYLRVPITLYEPNIVPGKVNKLFSFFSKRTLILFDEVKKHLFGESKLLTLTLRNQYNDLPSKELIREGFGLDPDVTTVLVFGGSKGAQSINHLVSDILIGFDGKIQVIHLTGSPSNLKEEYEKNGVKAYVTTFLKEMERAWKAADFAICRSGAGAIKESLIHETPVMLIPYPFSLKDHQGHNARFLADVVGSAKVFLEKDFSREDFIKELEFFYNPDNREEMIDKIKQYLNAREGVYLDSLLL